MYIASVSLSDGTVHITGPNEKVTLTYPEPLMAVNAYAYIAECCNRFSKDPDLNPEMEPKIYVYGEMYTWPQYLKKLLLTAEKIGAIVHITSVGAV